MLAQLDKSSNLIWCWSSCIGLSHIRFKTIKEQLFYNVCTNWPNWLLWQHRLYSIPKKIVFPLIINLVLRFIWFSGLVISLNKKLKAHLSPLLQNMCSYMYSCLLWYINRWVTSSYNRLNGFGLWGSFGMTQLSIAAYLLHDINNTYTARFLLTPYHPSYVAATNYTV